MRFHPKYTQKVSQQGGGGVMVWGAISRRKVWPLVVIQGTMNALKFEKIRKLHPSAPWLQGEQIFALDLSARQP